MPAKVMQVIVILIAAAIKLILTGVLLAIGFGLGNLILIRIKEKIDKRITQTPA